MLTVPARPRMKTNPMTPTSGGMIIGMIVRYEKSPRPGKSYRKSRNAIAIPMMEVVITVPTPRSREFTRDVR